MTKASLLRGTLALALLCSAGVASAQNVTNAFDGFSNNSDEPVNIEADRLDVRDKDQAAVFTGGVVVTQGESRLETKELTVFYTGGATADSAASSRSIRQLEADGGVVVTSKDQKASGTRGVFNMAANTIVMTGNVIVSQGSNVIRGQRLFVDLTKQISRMETNAGSGRVQGVFLPNKGTPGAPKN
jgi:lipopolysaccharide export system protein LptA